MTKSGDAEKIVFDFAGNCPVDLESVKNWSPQCFQFLLSKFLSSAILLGSVAVKLPQVFNIVSTKNVVGLSPQAFYSEVPLATLSVLYSYRLGYAFTSYGESVMVLIQNMILVYLLWVYMQPKPSAAHKLSVLAVFVAVGVVAYHLPAEYLYVLPNINLALMMYARVAQIVNNFRQGTTGQLSSITTGLTFIGSVARIFTTMTEAGGDILLLASFGISTALSGTLLFQVRSLLSATHSLSLTVDRLSGTDHLLQLQSRQGQESRLVAPSTPLLLAWRLVALRARTAAAACTTPPRDAGGSMAAVRAAKGSSLNLFKSCVPHSEEKYNTKATAAARGVGAVNALHAHRRRRRRGGRPLHRRCKPRKHDVAKTKRCAKQTKETDTGVAR